MCMFPICHGAYWCRRTQICWVTCTTLGVCRIGGRVGVGSNPGVHATNFDSPLKPCVCGVCMYCQTPTSNPKPGSITQQTTCQILIQRSHLIQNQILTHKNSFPKISKSLNLFVSTVKHHNFKAP